MKPRSMVLSWAQWQSSYPSGALNKYRRKRTRVDSEDFKLTWVSLQYRRQWKTWDLITKPVQTIVILRSTKKSEVEFGAKSHKVSEEQNYYSYEISTWGRGSDKFFYENVWWWNEISCTVSCHSLLLCTDRNRGPSSFVFKFGEVRLADKCLTQ